MQLGGLDHEQDPSVQKQQDLLVKKKANYGKWYINPKDFNSVMQNMVKKDQEMRSDRQGLEVEERLVGSATQFIQAYKGLDQEGRGRV